VLSISIGGYSEGKSMTKAELKRINLLATMGTVFSILAVCSLLASFIAVVKHLPYEPGMALFFAFTGTAIVFYMKLISGLK
jgi:hypothetical protein